jgi:hypothetical protein
MRHLGGRFRVPAALCAAALLLGGAGIVPAAEDSDPDFSLENTIQAGPFHLAPFFVIKDLGYDDNVRLGANRRFGDYTLTVGPGARAVVPFGRRAAFSAWDEIDYAIFARESDLNHVNNSIRTKLHVYLRDVTLFVDGQQDSSRERPNTEIDFRIRATTTQGRFGLSWRPSTRGRLDLYTGRTGFRYHAGKTEISEGGDPVPAGLGQIITNSLQRQETILALEGRLQIRPRTTFLLDARAGRIEFTNATPNRDSSSASFMGGLEFDPSGSVRGFVKLGYKHLSPNRDSVDGFSGLVADASVSARVLGRGEIRAGFQRNTGFSILGNNLFYVADARAIAYEHYFNSRISVEVGRKLENVELPLRVTNPETCRREASPADPNTLVWVCDEEVRRDHVTTDTLAVRYRLGPSLRVGLAIGRWGRDSTFGAEDANRGTITTLVEYTP